MQRVFIVHGWTGTPHGDWMPWAKKELTKKGYEVTIPEMPDTDHPKITPWINKLTEVVGVPRKDDIFIGHSIGCQTIERYMQTLSKSAKVEKVILIAPWIKLTPQTFEDLEEDREVAKPWLREPIDYKKIRRMTKWTAVFSDNDPYVKYEDNYKVYKDKLGAKIILIKGKYHFNMEYQITRIPFLLDLIK